MNVIVLRTFDDDASPATPFGAGSAANLIATQITIDGAGLFIFFNSSLDLALLVYSTATNFAILDASTVPEPGTLALLGFGFAVLGLSRRRTVP